jgi:hypothetical protein
MEMINNEEISKAQFSPPAILNSASNSSNHSIRTLRFEKFFIVYHFYCRYASHSSNNEYETTTGSVV